MASLFTGFEELSHIMSLFWSRDKVNRGIRLFHEQNFEFVPLGEQMELSSFIFQTWEE